MDTNHYKIKVITLVKVLSYNLLSIYLALLTLISNSVLEELNQIQKIFTWGNKQAKIKHDTLCNNFTKGGFKSENIKHKTWALKCSWL